MLANLQETASGVPVLRCDCCSKEWLLATPESSAGSETSFVAKLSGSGVYKQANNRWVLRTRPKDVFTSPSYADEQQSPTRASTLIHLP